MILHFSLLLFSSLTIVTAGLASLVIFFLSSKEISRLHSASLSQCSLALFLFAWVRVPTVLAVAGAPLPSTVTELIPAYFTAFIALIIAYLLFYRGTIMLFTRRKFWLNTFPLLTFTILTSLIFILYFWLKIPLVSIFDIVSIFSYMVILFLIAATVKLLRTPLFSLAKIGLWFILIGWLIFLVSDMYLVQIIHNYPSEFWFFALTSSPTVYMYLGFTIAHLLLLVGFILSHKHEGKDQFSLVYSEGRNEDAQVQTKTFEK